MKNATLPLEIGRAWMQLVYYVIRGGGRGGEVHSFNATINANVDVVIPDCNSPVELLSFAQIGILISHSFKLYFNMNNICFIIPSLVSFIKNQVL